MQTVLSIFPLILTQWRPSLQTEAFQSWEARYTNCFLLTNDLQRLPRIRGITSWNEGRDCRKDGDFAPSEVTTTASKLIPSRRKGRLPRKVFTSTPRRLFAASPVPQTGSQVSTLQAKERVHENFTARLQPWLGTRKGSGTLPHDEAVIKLEQRTLICPVYLQLMG